jgi:hypothetical protein
MPTDFHELPVKSRFSTDELASTSAGAAASGAWKQVQTVGAYLMKQALVLSGVAILVVLIGEVWLRAPWAPHSIQYVFDEELGHRYMPNQIATPKPLGLFSVEAPAMVLDENGFRNSEVDWSHPVILALGSSEIVGPGVAEGDIWTARLAHYLSEANGTNVTVYNAGTAAYGPYHQMVVLRRFVQQHGMPGLIIVRVSLADREFLPMSDEDLRREKTMKERRDRIKRYSLFVPFLLAKAQLQMNSIRAIPSMWHLGPADGARSEIGTTATVEQMWLQQSKYWNEMASFAHHLRIPLVFLVSDPSGTDGGEDLFRAIRRDLAGDPCRFVWLLGSKPFGLSHNDVHERVRAFTEAYTLRYDPHANALQHRIIAKELFGYLQALPIDLRRKGACSLALREAGNTGRAGLEITQSRAEKGS